jgi:hypothetical protein
MCDYSLHHVKSRPAKVGDKLATHRFNLSTTGFSAPEDIHVAVWVLPGTELGFADEVRRAELGFADEVRRARLWPWTKNVIQHKTAIFRQVTLRNRKACFHATF